MSDGSSETVTHQRMRAHRKELDRRRTRKVRIMFIVDESRKHPGIGRTDASLEAAKEWVGECHV